MAGRELEREAPRLEVETASAEETEALGCALGARLAPGDVVALSGELGSGKTCFVRGLARGLGVEGPVASPSFTLMHVYPGAPPLYHFDAWMRGRGEAFLADGGANSIGTDGVAAIEWAERVAAWLPAVRIEVELAHAGGDRRRIAIRVRGPQSDASRELAARLAGFAAPGGGGA
jgi:tRNA threonylcarbamoyladenosine biosynthesis protein TsaE